MSSQVTDPEKCLYLFIIGLSLFVIYLLVRRDRKEFKAELKKEIIEEIKRELKI
jgi:hypothetical protein